MLAFSLFLVLLSLCAVVCPSVGEPVGTRCAKLPGAPSCVCNTVKGTIDLTRVALFNGTAKFTGIPSSPGYLEYYNYNPCATFSFQQCLNVYVCDVLLRVNQSDSLADFGSEQMMLMEDGKVYVHYSSNSNGHSKETFVHLNCDPKAKGAPVVAYQGEPAAYRYEFNLTSCHACPGGCLSDQQP